MKQIKIIGGNELSLSNNQVLQVNFNEPIIVNPGATLALDKFSMVCNTTISNPSFIIPTGETISITKDVEYEPDTVSTVSIPAGTYSSVNVFLAQLNTQFNSILNSNYVAAPGYEHDAGMMFLNTTDGADKVVLAFASVAPDITDGSIVLSQFISLDSDSYYRPFNPTEPDATNLWSLYFNKPIIRGGLQSFFKLNLPANFDVANNFEFGLYSSTNVSVLLFGLKYQDGDWFWVANGVDIPANVDFIEETICVFYVDPSDPSHLRFQGLDAANDDVLFESPLGTFEGFNFNDIYFMGADGGITNIAETHSAVGLGFFSNYFDPLVTNGNNGWFTDLTLLDTNKYLTYTNPIPRKVTIDFTTSPITRASLGFINKVYSMPLSGLALAGSITSDGSIGGSHYFNLALEILNVNLESYIATTDRRQGTRKNILAYFTPIVVPSAPNTYVYEAKTLHYIGISQREPRTFESLQFRILDPTTPLYSLPADSFTFNIYINEPENGL